MPWQNMRKGPSTASRSLLLDYVSPMSILSAIRAIGRKDWAVVITVIGGLLLKLAVSDSGYVLYKILPDTESKAIVSTGLFSLQLTEMQANNQCGTQYEQYDMAQYDPP
jgi:hypothetical protein